MPILRYPAFRTRRTSFLVSCSILIFLIGVGSAYAIASGTRVWIRQTGQGQWNNHTVTAVDNHGNIYVAGSKEVTAWRDIYLIKYGMTGKLKWIRTYGGPANHLDAPSAMAIDEDNNIYVTGESRNFDQLGDIITIKYGPRGKRKWIRRFDGGGPDHDWGGDIAVDPRGFVYVFGLTTSKHWNPNYVIIKYDSSGKRIWLRRYDSGGEDWPSALAYGGAGSVVVTGESNGRGNFDYYFLTIKYDKNGRRQWIARHSSPMGYSEARDIATDVKGNVYVTGFDEVDPTGDMDWGRDIVTIKYNRDGKRLWLARHHRYGRVAEAKALTVDPNMNVFVVGTEESANGRFSYVTIKYGPSGGRRWIKRYARGTPSFYRASDIAIGRRGNVFVTGYGPDEFRTIKYSGTGRTIWSNRLRLDRPESRFDRIGPALAVDNRFGQVYVSGNDSPNTGLKTIRYAQ